MYGVAQGGIDTGWGCTHCCACELPPVGVAEHKNVPSHDQFESRDDGFGGQSNGKIVVEQEEGNFLEGVIGIYFSIHGDSD
jgi:hypothetical protein